MNESCKDPGGDPKEKPEDGLAPDSVPATAAGVGTTFRVEGMDCADEVQALERALKPLRGVRDVRVNLMGGKVFVAHDDAITPNELVAVINKAGLKATSDTADGREAAGPAEAQRARLISVALSALFTGAGLMVQWTKIGSPELKLALFLPAITAGGWFIFPKALGALRGLSLDMSV